jgi:ketosteroid isomerase-like protein
VSEAEDFLAVVLPRLEKVDTAFHNGDAGPRFALWSHNDPVTLLGASLSGIGWGEIGPAFELLASQFSDAKSFEIEVIAADAKGDLGYLVAIEHSRVSIRDTARNYALRVTTILRRENGEWKVVHRHADPVPDDEPSEDQPSGSGEDK